MGESPITLGKLIKSARLEAGLTQDNLAMMTHTSCHQESTLLPWRQGMCFFISP